MFQNQFSEMVQQAREKWVGGNIFHRLNTFCEQFSSFHEQNRNLSDETKLSALKISPSVVSIMCTTIDKKFEFYGTGTMIKCKKVNDTKYITTILTSASVFGSSSKERVGADPKFKVEVYLCGGSIFKGRAFNYDLHYNIATLKIKSTAPMSIASLKNVEVTSIPSEGLYLRRHSGNFHLSYCEKVIAIGRHCDEPFNLMAAPGTFSRDGCNLDCPPMLKATCNISICGTGGPLINSHGEVIGINFYDERHTPFLLTNIALKCLENFENNGKFARPCFGVKGANLCSVSSLNKLEKIIQKLPDISKGILVKEVVPVSPAHHAGIRVGDVLVQCDGDIIQGLLEFEAMLLDKVGDSMEVLVLRKQTDFLKVTVVVDEFSTDKFYSWPLPKERMVVV